MFRYNKALLNQLLIHLALGGIAAAQAAPDGPARGIGRAGLTAASADGEAAFVQNPANFLRSGGWVIGLSLGFALADWELRPEMEEQKELPRPRNLEGAQTFPSMFVSWAGDVWSAALGFRHRKVERQWAEPAVGQLASDIAIFFPHRYGGLHAEQTQSTLSLAGGLRASNSVAIGLALDLGVASQAERRMLWAGFSDRETVGDPSRDILAQLETDQTYYAAVGSGMTFLPEAFPLELGLGIRVNFPITYQGQATLVDMNPAAAPIVKDGTVAANLKTPWIGQMGLGARWSGDWYSVDIGGEYFWRAGSQDWNVENALVEDQTGVIGRLSQVPSLLSTGKSFAACINGDIAVLERSLWLSGGLSVSMPASSQSASPVNLQTPRYQVGIGVESQLEQARVVFGLGWLFQQKSGSGGEMVNPFAAGSAEAAPGTYVARDLLAGISMDLAF